MIEPAISRIVDLTKESTEPKKYAIHRFPEFPDKVFIQHGDEVVEKDVPPPRRLVSLESIDSFVAFATDSARSPAPVVYLTAEGAVIELDDSKRVERAGIRFAHSEQWVNLCRLADGLDLTPAQLIKMFRFELPAAGAATEALVRAVRRVDFSRTSTGQRTTEIGRAHV